MNADASKESQDKKIVLVVDGDSTARFFTSVYLLRLDYHVFSVATAEEALRIMELVLPLIVITEIALPQMDGIALLKALKEDRGRQRVPVLVYTSIKDPAAKRACEQAGCDGFLTQGPDHNVLYEAVQRATENKPRHFIRLATWLDAVVSLPGGGDQTALVTAISEQGMFVSMANPLPHGAQAFFTVHLPKVAPGGIRIPGQVLYSHAGGAGRTQGVGVKFLSLPPQDAMRIKTFIQEKLTTGLGKGDRQALR